MATAENPPQGEVPVRVAAQILRRERTHRAGEWNGTRSPHTNHAPYIARLWSTLVGSTSEKQVRRAWRALWAKAAKGDVHAAELVFNRLWGRPLSRQEIVVLEVEESTVAAAIQAQLERLSQRERIAAIDCASGPTVEPAADVGDGAGI
jgi:hypothetical protein